MGSRSWRLDSAPIAPFLFPQLVIFLADSLEQKLPGNMSVDGDQQGCHISMNHRQLSTFIPGQKLGHGGDIGIGDTLESEGVEYPSTRS